MVKHQAHHQPDKQLDRIRDLNCHSENKLNGKTHDYYRNSINTFIELVGDIHIEDLSKETVRQSRLLKQEPLTYHPIFIG